MAKKKSKKKEVDEFLSMFKFEITFEFMYLDRQSEALSELVKWLSSADKYIDFEFVNGFDGSHDTKTLIVHSSSVYGLREITEKVIELFPEPDWDD